MNDDLQTLSKLFTEKLFRIPDYQRGYAWTEAQLADYWSDISQIGEEGNHYTGVLTLEIVPRDIVSSWHDDQWIIKSKSFDPFYVVDGQQRLTTSIILIQCIANMLRNDDDTLNYTTKHEIQKKYLFDTRDSGISRSYIFGYEKDNPSYEYLKTEIFGELSASDRKEETVYTNNLLNAKDLFSNKISELEKEDLEDIYIKVTQRLLFNIFSISDEVDVCVAFETMNNRGKPLSYLELLKNRLIYLSTKLNVDESETFGLRKTINECWKTIYHNLGRNKSQPLDDDFFLRCHHFLNFVEAIPPNAENDERAKKGRQIIRAIESPEYKNLLNEIFTFGSISDERKNSATADSEILERINSYSISLQESVKMWFAIFNPVSSTDKNDYNFWLAKLNKIASPGLYPTLLSIMLCCKSNDERVRVFSSLERMVFLDRLSTPYYSSNAVNPDILSKSIDMYKGRANAEEIIKIADTRSDLVATSEWGKKQIKEAMKSRNFYTWKAIHYLLFEHNLHLQLNSKTSREKIEWNSFAESLDDYRSIEHIYPQTARGRYWVENFKNLSASQRDLLKNVIGNLLPLSKPKNSSLSNLPYPEKVRGRTHIIGYSYGSYAENEVAVLYENWTPHAILDRSLRLLDFVGERWKINFGKDAEKIEMLGLGFVKPNSRLPPRHSGPHETNPNKKSSKARSVT